MSAVAETYLFVFGTRVSYQHICTFEINGFVVVEYRPDPFAAENLIAFVVRFINML
jgi:hypothetical protein